MVMRPFVTPRVIAGCGRSNCAGCAKSARTEASGVFPNAINIPLDELRGRLHELPTDKEILVVRQVGLRGHVAYRMLVQHGISRFVVN